MGLTKAELVNEVARATRVTRKEADTMVSAILDGMVASLQRGEKIELRGFGSFRIRRRNARTGRNPRTGARVHVPAKRIPYFKPGRDLRQGLNHDSGESGS